MVAKHGRTNREGRRQGNCFRKTSPMSFDITKYLGRATARAKSDVANKMVSMFLHEISRRIASEVGLRVTDPAYVRAVADSFGEKCVFCRLPLELNRAAVEHLDGMNRFRAGLHIPGNVTVACVTCNREKRRDDQVKILHLADSGWESFLSHDSRRCADTCKTCQYWRSVWPDPQARADMLERSRKCIAEFRNRFSSILHWSTQADLHLRENLEVLYRECQEFASTRIDTMADVSFQQMQSTLVGQPGSKSR